MNIYHLASIPQFARGLQVQNHFTTTTRKPDPGNISKAVPKKWNENINIWKTAQHLS